MLPNMLPLTQAQAGVWYAQRLDPANPIYTIAEYVEISGTVDPQAFEHALRQVVTEADALRVRIEETDGAATQVVESEVDWQLSVVDLTAVPDPHVAALDWMRRAQSHPVDPAAGVPFAFALLHVAVDRVIWFQRYHHAVLDGLGMSLIEQRVAAVYTAHVTGTEAGAPVLAPLARLVDAEAGYRAGPDFAADRAYWARELADAPSPVTLGDGQPGMPARLAKHTTHLGPDEVGRDPRPGKGSGDQLARGAGRRARHVPVPADRRRRRRARHAGGRPARPGHPRRARHGLEHRAAAAAAAGVADGRRAVVAHRKAAAGRGAPPAVPV